jgi:hypothetical protein
MSHKQKIRDDKQCQNCGHEVAERFCPACGQENIETRHPFYYLFTHFFSDFVHYDGKFWKTIRYLLFRPARLSREYLDGKRKSYVNPVQLYIFISFITFFVPAMLPEFDENPEKDKHKTEEKREAAVPLPAEIDHVDEDEDDSLLGYSIKENGVKVFGNYAKSVEELDSIRKSPPAGQKLSWFKYAFYKRILILRHAREGTGEKIVEDIVHQFPKAIFLYMPFFAFSLWVFHSKKKWLYFDHGIYTLHYFSFILLSILIYILLDWLFKLIHIDFISSWLGVAMIFYFIYYFFHSHRKMYRESKAVSRTKCTFLFFFHSFNVIIFILLYVFVIFWISLE